MIMKQNNFKNSMKKLIKRGCKERYKNKSI